MHVVNTFRTSKGSPKFCIDLQADWLLILDEVGGKSPGGQQKVCSGGVTCPGLIRCAGLEQLYNPLIPVQIVERMSRNWRKDTMPGVYLYSRDSTRKQ